MDSGTGGWRLLGALAPPSLVEARLLLHHAAQLAAAPGRSLLPSRPDDSQTSLQWSDDRQALVGERVPGRVPWRAALRPRDLALLVLSDGAQGEPAALALAGRSPAEGLAWLRGQATARGSNAARLSREVPYELPAHALGDGGSFPQRIPAGCAELGLYFANAFALLRDFTASRAGASEVRCWPHHFDVGALIRLTPERGDESPTVGFGLSPGDEGIAEPYWYVNAWPRPESLPDPLPALPAGARWNTEGWLGAVLPASALVEAHEAVQQQARGKTFLDGAIGAADRLFRA